MMLDTQWPRFIVFHQEKAKARHTYAGSVHAPDAELALLNARDVFVRRPACISLWIVPASAIFARTAEEIRLAQAAPEQPDRAMPPPEAYTVFQKLAQRGTYSYVGEVNAASPAEALQQALATDIGRVGLAWWVFPSRFITPSTPEDIEIMFAPAITKDFRDQTEFHTVAALQQIKARSQESAVDEA